MSDQSFSLSALNAILEKARTERDRCQKELEKIQSKVSAAEAKVTAAESRVKTLEDTIAQLSGGTQGKSQKEAILEILSEHNGDGLSAREILNMLESTGFKITSQNPTASIHMAADQLIKDGEIETFTVDAGKLFRRKNKPCN